MGRVAVVRRGQGVAAAPAATPPPAPGMGAVGGLKIPRVGAAIEVLQETGDVPGTGEAHGLVPVPQPLGVAVVRPAVTEVGGGHAAPGRSGRAEDAGAPPDLRLHVVAAVVLVVLAGKVRAGPPAFEVGVAAAGGATAVAKAKGAAALVAVPQRRGVRARGPVVPLGVPVAQARSAQRAAVAAAKAVANGGGPRTGTPTEGDQGVGVPVEAVVEGPAVATVVHVPPRLEVGRGVRGAKPMPVAAMLPTRGRLLATTPRSGRGAGPAGLGEASEGRRREDATDRPTEGNLPGPVPFATRTQGVKVPSRLQARPVPAANGNAKGIVVVNPFPFQGPTPGGAAPRPPCPAAAPAEGAPPSKVPSQRVAMPTKPRVAQGVAPRVELKGAGAAEVRASKRTAAGVGWHREVGGSPRTAAEAGGAAPVAGAGVASKPLETTVVAQAGAWGPRAAEAAGAKEALPVPVAAAAVVAVGAGVAEGLLQGAVAVLDFARARKRCAREERVRTRSMLACSMLACSMLARGLCTPCGRDRGRPYDPV